MGWGLLFLGYLLKFILGLNPLFDVILTLPACILMLLGLKKLDLYCRTFRYAMWCVALVAAVTVGSLIGALVAPVSALPSAQAPLVDWLRYAARASATDWVTLAEMVAVVLFHAALALGVKDIATRVGVQKNAVRAMRNLVVVGLYAVSLVLAKAAPATAGVMMPTTMLIRLVFAVCNGVLLYSCYMRIAPAEETEQLRKPSRIAWVNRLRDAYDEKTQKAIDADRAYHEKNARERREKQLARMSEKQRRKEEIKRKRNQR